MIRNNLYRYAAIGETNADAGLAMQLKINKRLGNCDKPGPRRYK